MEIPLVTYINTKKKFGKKSTSQSNSPTMSSSPKNIPTPRTYATVIAPTMVSTSELNKLPVMEYPPLPIYQIVEEPIKRYELFPMKTAIPKETQPFREKFYNIPPNPPYIQKMLYTEHYPPPPPQNYPPHPSQNYPPPPPSQNYPPPQHYMKILAMMHYHESFWNRFCNNASVRGNVRESFKYFPH
jgi:hypothetical protein